MVYRFTFVSDEVEEFVRIIEINADASFLDLHKAIIQSVGYAEDQITSFFMCADDWEKEQEVTLFEVEATSEYDSLTMEATPIEELVFDEKQKLLFVYDVMFERSFFGELTEIISKKHLDAPVCTTSEGVAPPQSQDIDDMSFLTKEVTIDENFYGDESYSIDELDADGYGDMTFDDNPYN